MAEAKEERVKGMSSIEDAEMSIRLAVKNFYFFGHESKEQLDKRIAKIIQKAVGAQKGDMKEAVYFSLMAFYRRQWRTISQIGTPRKRDFMDVKAVADGEKSAEKALKSKGYDVTKDGDGIKISGVPAMLYQEIFYKTKIKPIIDRLSGQTPRDPNDTSGHNSLRNRAEMEARNDWHQENIADMRNGGNRLVIASEHTNCSERCREWQGRVYSLDGTSGRTTDGRSFIPLEKATDVFYTTKTGKTYKNGLLGFNCRHYLVPYKDGFRFPKQSARDEERAYKIDQTQRHMERKIREWKTKKAMCDSLSREEKRLATKKIKEWTEKYKEFSHEHDMAYYPSRIKV